MHPSKIIQESDCRISFELGGVCDNRLKEKLMGIHPKNFIKSDIVLPLYEVSIAYDTINDNHREGKRYIIANSPIDKDGDQICFMDFEARHMLESYNEDHPDKPMTSLEVMDVECICELVLRIA